MLISCSRCLTALCGCRSGNP